MAWRRASSTAACHEFGGQVPVEGDPASRAEAARLHPAALFHHHRDIQPHQRPDVSERGAVLLEDAHGLPLAGEGNHDLLDPGVLLTGVGIDFREQIDLPVERRPGDRIVAAVHGAVGVRRSRVHGPGIPRPHRAHGIGRPAQRLGAQFGGVSEADGFAEHGAKAKPLGRVAAGAFQVAVIERQAFRLDMLEEQLAIVGPGKRALHDVLGIGPGTLRTREEQLIGFQDFTHELALFHPSRNVSRTSDIGPPHRQVDRNRRPRPSVTPQSAVPDRRASLAKTAMGARSPTPTSDPSGEISMRWGG